MSRAASAASTAKIRRSHERGHTDLGWLDSYHSFSFGNYYDPDNMGFRSLRVINEDRVAPGKGFGTHPHNNMEIISVVLEGALEHQDSLGTGSVIRPGDVQRMTAGSGATHSEFNHSTTQPVHFLQIWILPEKPGLKPGYEQKTFAEGDTSGRLLLIGSRDGRQGSITIHQDVNLYTVRLDAGTVVRHAPVANRHVYAHVTRGGMNINGHVLRAGDGLALTQPAEWTLTGEEQGSEALVFDLA